MQHLQPNATLQGGKYKIVRFISAGGFGCTYEAEHVLLHKKLAIKEFYVKDFCNRDKATSQVIVGIMGKTALFSKLKTKFIGEAQAVCSLKHPNIVNVFDVFEENGTAYYVMDYINGLSLKDMVVENGPLSEQKAVGYIRQVADALEYVHSQNRLHLDIKPGNIMVDENDKAVLIDFGASKQYDEVNGENTSTLLGNTPGYAPLEQMGNDVVKFHPSTDIYALGATLYKLLTGKTPLSASLLASGEKLEPLPSFISEGVCSAVYKSMQTNKLERPQSIAEFFHILDTPIDDEHTIFYEDDKNKDEIEEGKVRKLTLSAKDKKKGTGIVATVLVIAGIIFAVINSNSSSIETFTVNGVSFDKVKVKGGTFSMGATSEMTDPFDDEKPIHTVKLSSYYIGKTEVTQALWKAVMGNNPSNFKGDNLPVEKVSWNDCKKFISKLNSKTGKEFRLPTEAEWEFAARGGNKSKHYQYSGSNNIDDVAWYWKNSGDKYLYGIEDYWNWNEIEKNNSKTHAVATKQPNELGIYDMSGNVVEWCSDWYGNYSSSSQTNPAGPDSGSGRVNRGGSWYYDARGCRSSYRNSVAPNDSYSRNGFRLALSL